MSAVSVSETNINSLVIAKQLDSPSQLLRELVAGVLFDVSQDGCLGFGVSSGCLISNKLSGPILLNLWYQLTLIQRRRVVSSLARLLLKVQFTYIQQQQQIVSELGGVISWRKFTELNQRALGRPDLVTLLDQSLAGIQTTLSRLRHVPLDSLTLVHGDLNLANIILQGQVLRLIDFEHAVEGPLELEFAPMLFWADSVSLPPKMLFQALSKLGCKCSRPLIRDCLILYFVNQLRLALDSHDQAKTKLLITKQQTCLNQTLLL